MMTNSSDFAHAAPIPIDTFQAMAARCAPGVPENILKAVAHTESDFDPWVIHDDTTDVIVDPKSLDEAVLAASKMLAHGDSLDIGLMQINSANLAALGMTIFTALDPCASMAGGAAVLQAAYGPDEHTAAEQQVALLMALSRYNTGSPIRGIMNGYARRVEDYLGNEQALLPMAGNDVQELPDPSAPPSWDISATGAYARTHGAPWLITFATGVQSPEAPTQQAPTSNGQALLAHNTSISSTTTPARSQ